jgi:hypothetical protein
MDFKQEIELILEKLKIVGIDRSTIEKDLNYSKNYIDQTLSRGGNEKILGALKLYAQSILQNATFISQDQQPSMLNADPVEYEVRRKWMTEIDAYALINALLEEKDRSIKKAEESALKAEEFAKKMGSHYEDVVKENSKLIDIISNTLKEISRNLSAAATILNQNNQQLAQLNDQAYKVTDQPLHQQDVLGTKQDSGKKNKGH